MFSSYRPINTLKLFKWKKNMLICETQFFFVCVCAHISTEKGPRECVCMRVFVFVCAGVGKTNTLTSSTVSGIHMRYSFINMVLPHSLGSVSVLESWLSLLFHSRQARASYAAAAAAVTSTSTSTTAAAALQ